MYKYTNGHDWFNMLASWTWKIVTNVFVEFYSMNEDHILYMVYIKSLVLRKLSIRRNWKIATIFFYTAGIVNGNTVEILDLFFNLKKITKEQLFISVLDTVFNFPGQNQKLHTTMLPILKNENFTRKIISKMIYFTKEIIFSVSFREKHQ